MLVLKAGKQVAFGDAKEMLEAVRKLQVVTAEANSNAEASPDTSIKADLPAPATGTQA
jgi:hypothetical protein